MNTFLSLHSKWNWAWNPEPHIFTNSFRDDRTKASSLLLGNWMGIVESETSNFLLHLIVKLLVLHATLLLRLQTKSRSKDSNITLGCYRGSGGDLIFFLGF